MGWLMILLFFVSGATALIGEVVWMRMLGLVLGNTVWAAAVAVAVWMAGMALGAGIGARLAPRTRHHLRWYGLAEGLVGIFYVASPHLHALLLDAGTRLGAELGGSLTAGLAQRALLACAALLPPTMLMGLTLPLLVERLRGSGLAARVSALYGANTFGAAFGVLLTAYVLLPRLGERGTLAAAAVACALILAAAIVAEDRVDRPPRVSAEAPSATRSQRGYLVLAAAMGAAALAAELIWVRILVLHLGSRVYAFAVLLGVYLLGLAIGSTSLRAFAPRIADPRRALARVQAATAALLVAQLLALGYAGDLLYLFASWTGLEGGFVSVQAVALAAVLVLFLPVATLFGASFPLAVAADPTPRSAGAHAGVVGAANTMGAIVGALAAPFLLVPWIGCQRSLLLVVIIHAVVAVALERRRGIVLAAAAATLAAATAAALLPGDWVLRRSQTDDDRAMEIVELEETLGATVLVKRYHDPQGSWLSLELNGVNVAGSSPALLAVQQLQGNLPLLQAARPERVLHIGFGSGGTCWSVSRYPVERIDVVEISPEVLAAADRNFPDINHGVLHDPRVRVIVNDGRNFLLATEELYDVILSDSIHPVYAGNSTLYTVEYFRLCRERLRPGGIVSMWLPLYSLDQSSYLRILAAFAEVFPHTLVWYDLSTPNEFTVVTGRVEPGPVRIYWDRMRLAGVAESLAVAGVGAPEDIMADLLLGPESVRALTFDIPPHEDDVPWVEYVAGRTLHREATWRDNLLMLMAGRSRMVDFEAAPGSFAAAAQRRDDVVRDHLRLLGRILNSGSARGAGAG